MITKGLDALMEIRKPMDINPGDDVHADDSGAQLSPKLAAAIDKPVIGVGEAGALYDVMIDILRDSEACIFRSCKRAVHALAIYVEARLKSENLVP